MSNTLREQEAKTWNFSDKRFNLSLNFSFGCMATSLEEDQRK